MFLILLFVVSALILFIIIIIITYVYTGIYEQYVSRRIMA
jgi:hypothetical protein